MRRWIGWLALLGCLFVALPARAGSYLDRASMLVDGTQRDALELRRHMVDKDLVAVVQRVAEARLSAGQRMQVPASVAKAHPHLLLLLSAVERAATAAVDGNYKAVLEHLEAARREETIFRSALRELGHPLPATPSPRARVLAPPRPTR